MRALSLSGGSLENSVSRMIYCNDRTSYNKIAPRFGSVGLLSTAGVYLIMSLCVGYLPTYNQIMRHPEFHHTSSSRITPEPFFSRCDDGTGCAVYEWGTWASCLDVVFFCFLPKVELAFIGQRHSNVTLCQPLPSPLLGLITTASACGCRWHLSRCAA